MALRRIWAQLRKAALRVRLGQRWGGDGDLALRRYPSYATYLDHQRLKLDGLRARSIGGHAERFHRALGERLARLPFELRGRSVLCLGAREGAEVRAFLDRGAFAIGVDLNPGRDNRWVVVGDFHALQYADRSVGVVYTNSLDHVFDLERVLAEVRRVLEPNGLFLVELGMGTRAGEGRGFYEALSWNDPEEVLARMAAAGFREEGRTGFAVPWTGVQVALRKTGG